MPVSSPQALASQRLRGLGPILRCVMGSAEVKSWAETIEKSVVQKQIHSSRVPCSALPPAQQHRDVLPLPSCKHWGRARPAPVAGTCSQHPRRTSFPHCRGVTFRGLLQPHTAVSRTLNSRSGFCPNSEIWPRHTLSGGFRGWSLLLAQAVRLHDTPHPHPASERSPSWKDTSHWV